MTAVITSLYRAYCYARFWKCDGIVIDWRGPLPSVAAAAV